MFNPVFKRSVILFIALVSFIVCTAQIKTIDQRVDSVLKLMTLEEKAGQMNQYNGPWAATGPLTNDNNLLSQIKDGKVGSMLNVTGVARTKELQQVM